MRLHCGDALEVLPTLPSGSVDVCITDPPYPHIKREYGYWTEAEWFALMRQVVPQCMRALKPTGSAVFILQPNSERVGRMRTWLWDFLAWVGREWGVVQDAYWWNPAILPNGGANSLGLMRASVKTCVWVGSADCYRDQGAVLLPISENHKRLNRNTPFYAKEAMPSGNSMRALRCRDASERRGGTTPFNMMAVTKGAKEHRETNGHGAGTPLALCDWWTRYLCPPGGTVLDPFAGSGTTGVAAVKRGCNYVGVERVPKYHAVAERRIAEAGKEAALPLFASGGVT